jgi:hypothetical protein
MSNPIALGVALRSTVEAIKEIVDALHTGRMPSDLTANPTKQVYWSPSFQSGRAPESPTSVPYNALLLSKMLGNNRGSHAHPIVVLSLLICELNSLGALTEKDMADIFEGVDSFTQGLLQEVLTRTREAHYEVEATQLLEQTQ